jgi:flagellar L-ring protein precursor FlgH
MRHLLFALAVSILCSSACGADSIWDRRDQRYAFLFRDNRARSVGDLLTVIIREATDIDHREERELEKRTKAGGLFKLAGESASPGGSSSVSADFDTSTTSERTFDGSAEFTSEREFADRITVTVVDVLPNGNLLIQGRRRRLIAGEVRTLVVSGIVRPSDISPRNTIESSYIANFAVKYEGKGEESSYSRQGWLGRLINRIWPF